MTTATQEVTGWSFSKLGDFDKCKKYFWIKHIARVPEPERPLPPGKTEHANDRGSRIHDSAEHFVDGTGPFIPELREFQVEFEHLKHAHARGKVSLEGEWGMDADWEITGWNGAWMERDADDTMVCNAAPSALKKLPERGKALQIVKVGKLFYEWVPTWLRLKLDALCFGDDPTVAAVIDYKSGRKFGNEVKHAQQLQLYALVAFLRYPKLELIHSELWYLDAKDITTQTFTRDQSLRFKRSFDKKGSDIVACSTWPANPNKWSCQWCPYGPDGTGHCEVGVRKA